MLTCVSTRCLREVIRISVLIIGFLCCSHDIKVRTLRSSFALNEIGQMSCKHNVHISVQISNKENTENDNPKTTCAYVLDVL